MALLVEVMGPPVRVEDLPDVQNIAGDFKFPVKAGISGVVMPILVKTQQGTLFSTVAKVDMHVLLPSRLRGVNMSRLPIILSEMNQNSWVVDNLRDTLRKMLIRLESTTARMQLRFPYFYNKQSPCSPNVGVAHADIIFDASLVDTQPESYCFILTVKVPVITLCPCSKEISSNSAHNQRAVVTITVAYDEFVWIEELIRYAEVSSSAAPFPVLKRWDEKRVTEDAYKNPKFTEDVARGVASLLTADTRIAGFHVTVRSQESIHQYDAVAEVSGGLRNLWTRS